MFKTSLDLIIFLLSGGMAAVGNVLLKAGMNKMTGLDILKMVTTWEIIVGFFLYGFSSILYLKVISSGEVTKIYPMIVSYMFLLLLFLGSIFLKESFTFTKAVGILVIIAGIFLASR